MQETESMRQLDALLLRLDTVARGQVKALADELAATWEAHRAELGTYPPSNVGSINLCQRKSTPHSQALTH